MLLFNMYVWCSNHGFFFDTQIYEQITSGLIKQYPLANEEAYRQTFVPAKEGFTGVALNLTGLISSAMAAQRTAVWKKRNSVRYR